MPPAPPPHALRITLAILAQLWFHVHFWIVSSSSVKNVMGNFIGIILNLYIALGSMAIVMILNPPIRSMEYLSISLNFL